MVLFHLFERLPRLQQAATGNPLIASQRVGVLVLVLMARRGRRLGAAMSQWDGLVVAMAWPTVRTMVPREVRGANQSKNCPKIAGETESWSAHRSSQMPWKTSGTQPPPWFSAAVMLVWRSARVVLVLKLTGVRRFCGSAGGRVSASGQRQPGLSRPPAPRAEPNPHW